MEAEATIMTVIEKPETVAGHVLSFERTDSSATVDIETRSDGVVQASVSRELYAQVCQYRREPIALHGLARWKRDPVNGWSIIKFNATSVTALPQAGDFECELAAIREAAEQPQPMTAMSQSGSNSDPGAAMETGPFVFCPRQLPPLREQQEPDYITIEGVHASYFYGDDVRLANGQTIPADVAQRVGCAWLTLSMAVGEPDPGYKAPAFAVGFGITTPFVPND